ncbi:MAG: hypothetical protein ABI882_16410 [Acidobacteriota bacterium]
MKTFATVSRSLRGMTAGMARIASAIALIALCTLVSQSALAAPDSKFGELVTGKGVTVNGTPANGGLTVLSGSRIKVQPEGRAIVNLGRVGRVMLGSEADVVLNFADGKLTGELLTGWATVTAPKGVEIAIKTADGIAASDGQNASVLRIDLTGGTTRVESQSGAKLTDGQKTEFVAAGEEVELSHVDGVFNVARRTLEASAPARVIETASLGEVISASVRGAIESVVLDRTLSAPSRTAPNEDIARRGFESDTRGTQLTQQEAVTCGDFMEFCGGLEVGCVILPQIIKAKAGCTLSFIIKSQNVQIPAHVTIKPFMNSACFRLTPMYPQIVTLNPGQGYVGQINANSCPKNAYQYAQNTLIVIDSDTCGTSYIRVEWATPCK